MCDGISYRSKKKYESVDVRILELIISCPIIIDCTGETSKERKKSSYKRAKWSFSKAIAN